MSTLSDKYHNQIPMNYIHKGTKVLGRLPDGQVILFVAAMDGHGVSENYGRKAGNTHFADNSEKNYINVYFDVVARQEPVEDGGKTRGYGGAVTHTHSVNDSIYERDGWLLFVDVDADRTYRYDKRTEADKAKEREKDEKRKALTREIEAAQASLTRAQAALTALE